MSADLGAARPYCNAAKPAIGKQARSFPCRTLRRVPLAPYLRAMTRARRTTDWGFPRWRGYEGAREAARIRMCDKFGCNEPGNCPAPKSPNSPDRWYFCQAHAAEYNAGWDYFEGLSKEEAAERERAETQTNEGYRESAYYGWVDSGDGTRSRDELRALELLGLAPDAEFDAVRKAWRTKAKEVHPDVRPGDEDAAKAFQALQLAYEVLRAGEEIVSHRVV